MRRVGAVEKIQRRCRHQHRLPVPASDRLNESHREAGGDAVVRTALEKTLQPEAIDRLSGGERHDDIREDGPDKAVRDDGRRDWNSLSRPCEVPRRSAECPVCQARCKRRRQDGCGVREHSADRTCMVWIRESSRHRAGGDDEHRRGRTEQEQRGEVDHERRQHRRPVQRGRLPGREGCGQNRRQDERAEFERPAGLRPTCETQERPRADRRKCQGDYGRTMTQDRQTSTRSIGARPDPRHPHDTTGYWRMA